MVKVKELETLMKDFFIEPEETFRDIKRYLLSEFDWNVDTSKKTQFMIRGIPLEDDRKISDILNSFLPEEVIILREI